MTNPQIYTIDWKDSTKPTIVLPPENVDNTTSLVLYGWNKGQWAEGFLENFLRLLDNSSSADVPTNPTRGELWHDASTGDLKLYTGNMWKKLGTVDVMATEPTNVSNGQLWYDPTLSILKYCSNGTWVSIANDTATSAALSDLQNQINNKIDKVSLTPGTGTKITVNDQGAVTNVANIAASDVPTLPWSKIDSVTTPTTRAGYGITDAAPLSHSQDSTIHLTTAEKTLVSGISVTSTEINRLAGVTAGVQGQLDAKLPLAGGTMAGNIDFNGAKAINLADPSNSGDAITLNWYDALTLRPATGLDVNWTTIRNGLHGYRSVNSPDDSGDRQGVIYREDAATGLQFSAPTATVAGVLPEVRVRIMNGGVWTSFRELAYKDYLDSIVTSLNNQISTRVIKSGDVMSGNLSMNGNTVTGVRMPIDATEVASKQYVDSLAIAANDLKGSCRVATTGDITLNGLQTVDGISLVANDRVLVKNQANGAENGIYVVSTGSWTRSIDFNTSDGYQVTTGAFMFIEEGSTNSGSGWMLTTHGPITLGTTPLTFEKFNGLQQITAGAGMNKIGDTLNVASQDSSRIVVNTDTIDLATTAVTPGSWNNVTVDAYGRVTAGTNNLTSGSIDDIPIGNSARSTIKGTSIEGSSLLISGGALTVADTETTEISGRKFYTKTYTVTNPATTIIELTKGVTTLDPNYVYRITATTVAAGGAGQVVARSIFARGPANWIRYLVVDSSTGDPSSSWAPVLAKSGTDNVSVTHVRTANTADIIVNVEMIKIGAGGLTQTVPMVYGSDYLATYDNVGSKLNYRPWNISLNNITQLSTGVNSETIIGTSRPNSNSDSSTFISQSSGGGACVTLYDAAGNIKFITNSGITSNVAYTPTERMRITSGGQLYIGNTGGLGYGEVLSVTGDVAINGRTNFDKNYAEKPIAFSWSTATTIDTSLGSLFYATATSNTTFSFTNAPANMVTSFTLELINAGTYAITWPAAVKWPGGTAPTLTASGMDILTFYTRGNGTWRGVLAMKDSR